MGTRHRLLRSLDGIRMTVANRMGVGLLILLLVGFGLFAGSHERLAARTGLDSDLFNLLTVDVNGTEMAIVIVVINERSFFSRISPILRERLRPYLGKNALYINPTVGQIVDVFPFLPEQFIVEQEGSPTFTPERQDWSEITDGFLDGAFQVNPGGEDHGSGSEGILVLGDRIDIERPFWISYQGVRVHFDVAEIAMHLPPAVSPAPVAIPSRPPVAIAPKEQITDLKGALTEGEFSAEMIAPLLGLPSELVGTLTIAPRGDELRLLLIQLEEGIRASALHSELLTSLDPLIGTGAVMVWALSPTGADFVPWHFFIQQSGTNYIFFSGASFVELTAGFLRSRRVESDTVVAGVILFPGGVDRTLPFTVFYGTASASFPGAQGDQTP